MISEWHLHIPQNLKSRHDNTKLSSKNSFLFKQKLICHTFVTELSKNERILRIVSTMLQKLSKCEVKAWLCWNLMILPPLRFCVKSHFGEFKRSKNVIYGNFRDAELWLLVNLGLESCSNLLKSKLRTSRIAKNDIFGLFELTKIWFHVKSEWQ